MPVLFEHLAVMMQHPPSGAARKGRAVYRQSGTCPGSTDAASRILLTWSSLLPATSEEAVVGLLGRAIFDEEL